MEGMISMTTAETTARSSVYGLLARFLLGEWEQIKLSLTERPPDWKQIPNELRGILERLARTSSFAMKVEYDNLFVVPGKYYVPPFERVYQDAEAVEQIYQQTGFTFPALREEASDHLGCEMAFMQALILEQQAAAEKGQSELVEHWTGMQQQFLNEHLSKWIGKVRDRVETMEPDGLYVQVLSFAEEFVRFDKENFAN